MKKMKSDYFYFLPKQLDQSMAIKRGYDLNKNIDDNFEGFKNYFSAPNIRNKVLI